MYKKPLTPVDFSKLQEQKIYMQQLHALMSTTNEHMKVKIRNAKSFITQKKYLGINLSRHADKYIFKI